MDNRGNILGQLAAFHHIHQDKPNHLRRTDAPPIILERFSPASTRSFTSSVDDITLYCAIV